MSPDEENQGKIVVYGKVDDDMLSALDDKLGDDKFKRKKSFIVNFESKFFSENLIEKLDWKKILKLPGISENKASKKKPVKGKKKKGSDSDEEEKGGKFMIKIDSYNYADEN